MSNRIREEFLQAKESVRLNKYLSEIVKDGIATDYSEDEATKVLSADAVTADIDVHNGVFEATAWGCDLTHDYVTINADYRS